MPGFAAVSADSPMQDTGDIRATDNRASLDFPGAKAHGSSSGYGRFDKLD